MFDLPPVVGDAAYHLPPAGPPLILLALLPIGRPGLSIQASKLNIFARRLAFSSLSISALSWAHCELQKRERITPLPLPYHFSSPVPRDVRKAVLPPFLPEETMDKSIPWRGSILSDDITPTAIKPREDGAAQKNEIEITPPWRKKVSAWSVAPRSFAATYWEWSRMRRARQREIQHIRRNSIMGELIAYQKVRQLAEQNGESATLRWKQSNHTIREFNSSARDERSRPKMGWALVSSDLTMIGKVDRSPKQILYFKIFIE